MDNHRIENTGGVGSRALGRMEATGGLASGAFHRAVGDRERRAAADRLERVESVAATPAHRLPTRLHTEAPKRASFPFALTLGRATAEHDLFGVGVGDPAVLMASGRVQLVDWAQLNTYADDPAEIVSGDYGAISNLGPTRFKPKAWAPPPVGETRFIWILLFDDVSPRPTATGFQIVYAPGFVLPSAGEARPRQLHNPVYAATTEASPDPDTGHTHGISDSGDSSSTPTVLGARVYIIGKVTRAASGVLSIEQWMNQDVFLQSTELRWTDQRLPSTE